MHRRMWTIVARFNSPHLECGLDLMNYFQRIEYAMEKIVIKQWQNLADTALTKGMGASIISDMLCRYHDSLIWYDENNVFFCILHNPSLYTNTSYKPKLLDILQTTCLQKSQSHEKQDWKTVTDWRRLKTHDNWRQCAILDWTLEHKKGRKTGEIMIKVCS